MDTLKTILYMGSTHGLFTFYLPYQLSLIYNSSFDFGILHYLAFPLWLIGTLVILWCTAEIIRRGRGTPAHLDPPKELVIVGLYRYIRNPIYVGALLVLVGYILWFGSLLSALYAVFMFSAFQILVLIEESILRNTFGAAYEEYHRNVPRWIPKIK